MPTRFVHDLPIDPEGSPVEAEVVFGHAQVGSYRCDLWATTTATQSTEIAHGNNVDSVVDSFNIPCPAASLPGQVLGVTVVVQAPDPGPGQNYSVTVLFRQDGNAIGVVTDSGAFPGGGDTVSRLHFVKFR